MASFTKYWRFFWPLAVTGVAMLMAAQLQNGTLARYPGAVRELAVFAYASSLLGMLQAGIGFLPQMVNVMARSPRGKTVSLGFTLRVCLVLLVPVQLVAYTAPGAAFTARFFHISDRAVLGDVLLYLRVLSPLILVNGLRHYLTGLLVQCRRTGIVTVMNLVFMGTMLVLLIAGYQSGWGVVPTLAGAQIAAALLHLVLLYGAYRRWYRLPDTPEHEDLTYRATLAYFWPVALTSAMFALSRPVLYSFISRLPDAVAVVAALRVAFEFGKLFHFPVNQLRHVYITFYNEDRQGVLRFLITVIVGATVLMPLVVASPAGTFILADLMRVPAETVGMVKESLLVLCLMLPVVGWRNHYHGRALLGGTTFRMAVGAVCRVGAIWLGSWVFLRAGVLSHTTASLLLVLGFAAEAVVMMVAAARDRTLPQSGF